MARYVALVEFVDGEYWISVPGIDKAYSLVKRPEDIIPQVRNFLDDYAKPKSLGGMPIEGIQPPSLDDALTDPIIPFEGERLVIFEWEPPTAALETTP
jgi:hypothetical protein